MKRNLLCLIIIVSALTLEAHAIQCLGLLSKSASGPILTYKSETEFLFEDTESKFGKYGEPFHFNAFLLDGEVSITAVLRDENQRSKNLSGTKLFDKMINHFKLEKISKIHGSWFNYSDNYVVYQQARQFGMSAPDAALMTWTGQQALKHGFAYPSVSIVKDSSGLEHYDSIRVVFSKNPDDRSEIVNTVVE